MIKTWLAVTEMHVASLWFPFELLPLAPCFFPLPRPCKNLFRHHASSDELAAFLLPGTAVASGPLPCHLGLAGLGLRAPWLPLAGSHWWGHLGVALDFQLPAAGAHEADDTQPLPNTQCIIPTINPAFNMTQVQSTPSRGRPS